VPADHGDGLVKTVLFGLGEPAEVAFDAVDEPPDAGDLFVGWGGVGAGPVIDAVDGCGQAFPGA
jgi:hypothetical protein